MSAQRQVTQQQTQEEFDLQLQVSDLTTTSMELGRRHGLGNKAPEFNHLPLQQRRDRLEVQQDFIREANAERIQQGENPNMHCDLSREFDRQHPEPPTLSATTHALRNNRLTDTGTGINADLRQTSWGLSCITYTYKQTELPKP